MTKMFSLAQQIKVTMNDDDMDTYVFAVGTRKALVRLQKEMQDLVCTVTWGGRGE